MRPVMSFRFLLLILTLYAALATIVWFTMAGVSLAHEWYDAGCCDNKDCAAIPTDAVSHGPDGYIIELEAGEHPQAPHGGFWVVPYAGSGTHYHLDVRTSQDQQYHVCILEGHLRCLYAPEMMG